MAALNRPKLATYTIHETAQVDTADNEDHTFCGVMFPIRAKAVLPVEQIVINSLAVRGQLGNISVWVTNEDESPDPLGVYRIRLTARHWTKVYEQAHPPSQREYEEMDLSGKPIVIRPGQIRGIYIHSALPGDEALVYDNAHPQSTDITPRYQDSMIALYSGKAHLSPTPFGQMPIWGWGNAWRDRREFVGQIKYGAVYKLWNPELHPNFGGNFQAAARTLMSLQRRPESPFSILPDECVFYILNLCKWDWFNDNATEIKNKLRARKQKLRRERIEARRQTSSLVSEENEAVQEGSHQEQDQAMAEESGDRPHLETTANGDSQQAVADAAPAAGAAAEDDRPDNGDSDSDSDDSDGDDSNESEWERTNGYRADATAFSYRYMSSDEEREEVNNHNPPLYANLLARAWNIGRGGRGQQNPQEMDEGSDDL